METECIQVKRGSFNPIVFFNNPRWSIVAEESDIRSVILNEIYPAKIELVAVANTDGSTINGYERLERIKARDGCIRLDVEIFYALWTNLHLIPDFWKTKINNVPKIIYFEGSVFKENDEDCRHVICLYWENNQWEWSLDWLRCDSHRNYYSAVLSV